MTTYKGYVIKPHKEFPNNLVLASEGVGGSIPMKLYTMYTSLGAAKSAIDAYLGAKERTNGRKASTKS